MRGTDGKTTADLTALARAELLKLGFETGEPVERWEGDGVFLVTPPLHSEDRHWYLCMSGADNLDLFEEPGIDLILIRPKADGRGDDHIVLEDWDHLRMLLVEEGYLQAA